MPTILIIVGITGDLSRRKLLPAIAEMAAAGVLPEKFEIIGITRKNDVVLHDLFEKAEHAEYLEMRTELFPMSLEETSDYMRLGAHLEEVDAALGGGAQRLWYLAVPPKTAWPIIEHLGSSGLSKARTTKLLLEKPFGVDSASAEELVAHVESSFSPEQVYRIDHYLAKETVQNIVVFRSDNPLFEHTWNGENIERIDIVASESIGIEDRAAFYEQTGALRDLIQSHLLQLAALTLMKLPKEDDLHAIPEARHALLKTLAVDPDGVILGQYEGYKDEVGNPDSNVETFASVRLRSSDPRWKDVPITLTTGKALAEKKTEIIVTYRHADTQKANRLTLRLQPDEGVELCFFAKRPGYDHIIERVPLSFSYAEHFEMLPDAYERVFLDALRGDHTLFASSGEVIESWRITDAAREAWRVKNVPPVTYARGSAPKGAVIACDACTVAPQEQPFTGILQ